MRARETVDIKWTRKAKTFVSLGHRGLPMKSQSMYRAAIRHQHYPESLWWYSNLHGTIMEEGELTHNWTILIRRPGASPIT